jgi:hypothetical protein
MSAAFTESDPVNMTELAAAMRYDRRTVYRWIAAGYEPEFGHRTTVAHCKAWLRSVYAPMIAVRRRERQIELEKQLVALN